MAARARKSNKVVIAAAVATLSAAEEAAAAAPIAVVEGALAAHNEANFIDEGNVMPDNIGNRAPKAKPVDEKHSHIFARKKEGARRRFQNEYDRVGAMLVAAHLEDMKTFEASVKTTAKFNVALTKTQRERLIEMARDKVKKTLQTVFDAWHSEMLRIISSLGGMLQEDQSTVLFRDGSTASMPKGLWIDPAKRIVIA